MGVMWYRKSARQLPVNKSNTRTAATLPAMAEASHRPQGLTSSSDDRRTPVGRLHSTSAVTCPQVQHKGSWSTKKRGMKAWLLVFKYHVSLVLVLDNV